MNLQETLQLYKETGVPQEYIDELMLSQYVEGRNLDENNKEIWVCNCGNRIKKFTSRNDYVSHHLKGHS